MSSLVADSINTMGDPSAHHHRPAKQSISFVDSFRHWWNSLSLLTHASTATGFHNEKYHTARLHHLRLEYELYAAILSPDVLLVPPTKSPNLPTDAETDPDAKIYAELVDTQVEPGVLIHAVILRNKTNLSLPHRDIVVVHGYMAASGYFVKNFEALIKSYPNLTIHVIDLPGFGNSSRPKFPQDLLQTPVDASIAGQIDQILAIECWFTDKLEQYRLQWDLNRFDLIGHSMGAYLCSSYLLKYHLVGLVDSFVIVSPMGTESSEISLLNDSKYQFNHHEAGGNPFRELVARQGDEDEEFFVSDDLNRLWDQLGRPKFPKNFILRKLWEWHKSPFQLLQFFGPFYSKVLSLWSFQRFRNLKANNDVKTDHAMNVDLILKLHNYSFSIFNQYQGLGELAITKFINHEILPRLPLCDRGFLEYVHENHIKTFWMYGDKDWMNQLGGKYCYDKLVEMGNKNTKFDIIKDAGHHIYLDNPDVFNEACINFFGLV